MKKSRLFGFGRSSKGSTLSAVRSRQARFETLESRALLSVSAISPVSVMPAGPVLVPLLNNSAGTITYTPPPANSGVTATILPTNKLLRIKMDNGGEMDFLLLSSIAPNTVARFVQLVNSLSIGNIDAAHITSLAAMDAKTFSITNSAGRTVTFEFVDTSKRTNPSTGNVAVNFNSTTDAVGGTATTSLSGKMAAAINAVATADSSFGVTAKGRDDGTMELDGMDMSFNVGTTSFSSKRFFDGQVFSRIIKDFMIQAGDPNGEKRTDLTLSHGSETNIQDEFTTKVLFTQAGLLAMAHGGAANSGDSQFFITAGNQNQTRSLDDKYTIFGMLIRGEDVRQQIANTPTTDWLNTDSTLSESGSKPVTFPKITAITVEDDTHDGLLQVSLNSTAGDTTNVKVAASDGSEANIAVNYNKMVALNVVSPIYATAGGSTTVQLGSTDTENDPVMYGVGNPTGTTAWNPYASQGAVTYTLNRTTGTVLLTPTAAMAGLDSIIMAATEDSGQHWDTQEVPVYIRPAAPTVTFNTSDLQSGGMTRLNNSSSANSISFHVSGLLNAAITLSIYADRVVAADGTVTQAGTLLKTVSVAPTAGTADVTTDGATKLADGTHTFTAVQTIAYGSKTIESTTIPAGTLSSLTATPLQLTVFTALHTNSSAIAQAYLGKEYKYTVATNAPTGDTVSYTLTTKADSSMAIDASGNITGWTPTLSQASSTFPVTIHMTDTLGNTCDQSYTITVLAIEPGNPLTLTSSQSNVVVRVRSGQIEVYDVNNSVTLLSLSPAPTAVQPIIFADGVNTTVTIDFAYGGTFSLPQGLLLYGNTSPGSNTLAIKGLQDAANTIVLDSGVLTANGLKTTFSNVAKIRLDCGNGNDSYRFAANAVDVALSDTGGTDVVDFSGAPAGITLDLSKTTGQAQPIAAWKDSAAPSVHTLALTGVIENLTGTNYGDSLTGNSANNTICGLGGDDTILGNGGNDILVGGDGNDTIQAGSGRSVLIGGSTGYDTAPRQLESMLDQPKSRSLRSMFGWSLRRNLISSRVAQQRLGWSMQDDGATDTLYGNGGMNWFMPGKKRIVHV